MQGNKGGILRILADILAGNPWLGYVAVATRGSRKEGTNNSNKNIYHVQTSLRSNDVHIQIYINHL